jgi:hypothetical protein
MKKMGTTFFLKAISRGFFIIDVLVVWFVTNIVVHRLFSSLETMLNKTLCDRNATPDEQQQFLQ